MEMAFRFLRGELNMAVDRLLMEMAGEGELDFAVRVYGWSPACVSLGRHQDPDREVDRDSLASAGVDLVRRPTGGRAVWHETEVTYSVVAALDHPLVSGSVTEALRKVSAPLAAALGGLGFPVRTSPADRHSLGGGTSGANPCFTSHGRWEVGSSDGRKLVGSAQARSAGAFLQHGSIPLRNDQPRLAEHLPRSVPEERRRLIGELLESGTASLRERLPHATHEIVSAAVLESFGEAVGGRPEPLSPDDLDRGRLEELQDAWRIR